MLSADSNGPIRFFDQLNRPAADRVETDTECNPNGGRLSPPYGGVGVVMRRIGWFLMCCVSAAFLSGCGSGSRPEKASEDRIGRCWPYDLSVEVNDGVMEVVFMDACSRLKSGYNIFISRQPIADKYPGATVPVSIKPHNHPVYPGDTEPDDGIVHYTAERLENGVEYYVSARMVFPDQSMSKPSNEVLAVCGPRGEMELSVRYKSDHDGFSFDRNKYVRADNVQNDLYYSTKDGKDYLSSPKKLDGFLRTTTLKKLPMRGGIRQVRSHLKDYQSWSAADRLEIRSGDWILLQTADDTYGLVKVLGFEGEGEKRKVSLFYAYSARKGAPLF